MFGNESSGEIDVKKAIDKESRTREMQFLHDFRGREEKCVELKSSRNAVSRLERLLFSIN